MDDKLIAFFWKRVNKTATCWLWTGGKGIFGYGILGIKPRYHAHRFSWYLAYGQIADPSLCVLHKCDVPACVNPDHLFLGTRQDNMKDCIEKGRFNLSKYSSHPGESNVTSKLNNEKVRRIRQLRAEGMRVKEITAVIGVSLAAIEDVLYGRTWTHV
jgi:hypothetical protein